MEKRRYCSYGAVSPLFHNIFSISLSSGVKLHIHLLNVVVRFIVFLTSTTLIFRGTDISKCLRESLGIRDNEIRLYVEGTRDQQNSDQTAWMGRLIRVFTCLTSLIIGLSCTGSYLLFLHKKHMLWVFLHSTR